jgi:hypothetical protein
LITGSIAGKKELAPVCEASRDEVDDIPHVGRESRVVDRRLDRVARASRILKIASAIRARDLQLCDPRFDPFRLSRCARAQVYTPHTGRVRAGKGNVFFRISIRHAMC